MKQTLMNYLAVGGAGFVGAIARYFLGSVLNTAAFPTGTFLINLSGAFVLGWFMTVVSERVTVSPTLQLAIGVGFVGTYTTFSTMMYENDKFLQDGSWLKSALYLGGSVALGVVAVRLGVLAGHRG